MTTVMPISVRVIDATRFEDGGPVQVIISGIDQAAQVAEQVKSGGGRASVVHGRLEVRSVANRIADAAGRVGGRDLSDRVHEALDGAITSWTTGAHNVSVGSGTLPLGHRPVVMGIVNVTPDSFSDGGRYATADTAIAHGRQLLAEGADVLDIGGESTRPGAAPVSLVDELARVLPVVRTLAAQGACVSIDTTKAQVAREAVEAGAEIVNDVSAGRNDAEMLKVVAALGVPYVAMHAQGTPQDMQDDPQYDDVVAEVYEHLHADLARCVAAGIDAKRVILDPGFGFGKTVEHNLQLLRHLSDFSSLGCPLLVGLSRKSFLGAIAGVVEPSERVSASLAAAVMAIDTGVAILRVHDVEATVEVLRVVSSVRLGKPVGWETIASLRHQVDSEGPAS
ncbi:MAG: dihydropteroate synthase [Glaciecola sp.]|jgi:dihydropteroate synthase